MRLTLAEIARRIGGLVEGDGAIEIRAVAGLREGREGDLSFLGNPRYGRYMSATKASAVIVPEAWQGQTPAARVRVKDVNAAFTQAVMLLMRPPVKRAPGVHPTAVVDPSARLGRDVLVGPLCVVEAGAVIGDRTALVAQCFVGRDAAIGADGLIYPMVSIREYTRIGDRVILHSGVVLGSDGFGYEPVNRRWKKIPQVGVVVLGDDVELGANTAVDRARFGETRIGNGVKIDNLVQVAHNVSIGDDSAIAGQAGLAGSAIVGERVQIGGAAGIAGHLVIGDDAVVAAKANVTKDVPPGLAVSGYMAVPHEQSVRVMIASLRLPELVRKVAALERKVQELTGAK